MERTSRKSAATKELLRHVSLRSTGRLYIGAGAASVDVYVLNGGIVAAESADDSRQYLRRLEVLGLMGRDEAEALEAQIDAGESIFGELLDSQEPETMDGVLSDRFRENLARYVGSMMTPTFEKMSSVFVDNLQMGHNSAQLITSACAQWDAAARLNPDLKVAAAGHPSSELEKEAFRILGRESFTASALALRLPLEPTAAAAFVSSMIDSGLLVDAAEFEVDLTPVHEVQAPERDEEDEEAPTVLTEAVDDAATFQDLRVDNLPDEEEIDDDLSLSVLGIDDFGLDDLSEEVPRERLAELAESRILQPAADNDDEDILDDPSQLAPVPELEPELEANVDQAEGSSEGVPRNLQDWLDSSTHVSDEDMAFFGDDDFDRGGGEGGFTTEMHNLDRVEVGVGDEDEVIEVDEAPAAKFSAPTLSEEDALAKFAVLNDILSKVSKALDEAEGSGRGRALVELLVAGSPPKHQALLAQVEVHPSGELSTDDLLDNLWSRPESEHRQLTNLTIKSMIERALNMAADELPDEAFDDVYESVAGYNQRLGL